MLRIFFPSALIFSVLALILPNGFTWALPWIGTLLGIIMFGMGLTLTPENFRDVWKHKHLVLAGLAAQFTIMPLVALGLSEMLALAPAVTIGMVLVGSCPGGTASNVITYLARGNVALSVTLTMCSTLAAPLLTPLLIALLVGERIDVPIGSMMWAVSKIVLFPVIMGLIVRKVMGDRLKGVIRVFPYLSMFTIVFVIAIVIAKNQSTILALPWLIALAVVFHNAVGLAAGYGWGKILKANETDCRTLAIEVGMQNSGLAAALATKFFTPIAALPGAIFSLWHNLSGVALASWWSERGKVNK
ncbi:bile acid:sodium symporter family protein [Rubellicoccus peritrichatus]|uniref:Bile acid:sodium symporter family protein n=1 Tax=Rubellicoccus peritrichatus TaxID=3080537 RepID=A0AAQ3LCA2_9BACT|nr:bile acid:sodium symporter family protein [Puniceicoccus sp. CR14]WOO43025.1 bile acid:sodium symporter family protein [Puniceicoccus sp. CR14]